MLKGAVAPGSREIGVLIGTLDMCTLNDVVLNSVKYDCSSHITRGDSHVSLKPHLPGILEGLAVLLQARL